MAAQVLGLVARRAGNAWAQHAQLLRTAEGLAVRCAQQGDQRGRAGAALAAERGSDRAAGEIFAVHQLGPWRAR